MTGGLRIVVIGSLRNESVIPKRIKFRKENFRYIIPMEIFDDSGDGS